MNNEMIPFPNKKYDIIYADPPWQYEQKMQYSKALDHYSTMETENICKLPVISITNENALLFLWVTGCHVPDALEVGKAWGFVYSTVGFVWHKQKSVAGFYTMSVCEYVYIFKRGKIPQPRGERNIEQFLSVKKGSHSMKPNQIRNSITKMFLTQSKIELFARKDNDALLDDCSFDGWDYWGNEC